MNTLAPSPDFAPSRHERREVPPLSPRRQVVRAALLLVLVISFALLVQLTFVSGVQHAAGQRRAFDMFRSKLAEGTAPVGPTDEAGVVLPLGAGVAYLEIPRSGVKEVVLEGTTSAVLMNGPGHRRDTPLPGQVGTSVIFGRRASYGGPFADLGDLRTGDPITVTTGQGVFAYSVVAVRRAGDPLPQPLAANGSRLTLVSADGIPFIPNGVFYVDALLKGAATGGAPRLASAASLPEEERLLRGDNRTLWALALWLQALIVLFVGAVWALHRMSRPASWIIFLPPIALVGLAASGELARLLPNLL